MNGILEKSAVELIGRFLPEPKTRRVVDWFLFEDVLAAERMPDFAEAARQCGKKGKRLLLAMELAADPEMLRPRKPEPRRRTMGQSVPMMLMRSVVAARI